MHDDSALVERRIRKELNERVMPAMYSAALPLQVEAWDTPGEPVGYDEAMVGLASSARPFAVGEQWSRPWGTTWFRFTGDVPADWVESGCMLEAVIDLGFHPDSAGFQAEGLVWSPTGPVQGIHPRRTAVPLHGQQPGAIELIVEAASNPAFPMVGRRAGHLGSLATAGDAPLYRLRQAALCVLDETVFHLLLDAEVLLGLMTALPADEPRRKRLLGQLQAAFDVLDLADIASTAAAARAALAPALALPARASTHHAIGVGHAHIDSAWLWPIRETIRKCTRTFASATRLMDDYPEYRFVCSQAAQYDWIERRHPELFERIRAKVASGQWQPVGGMWVEADMNLPSGESLARQMVHGQRYFESRFGVRCTEAWIPDVFGYPATLPQIFRAGGCDRFITQKLSWNKTNKFPHSTFWWEGLDGSRVLTHFPPVDTYNALVSSEEMLFSQRNFAEHRWSDWSLLPYGYGNGGGGPTREMLERGRRLADLDGAPRLTMGTTHDFFDRVEAEAAAGAPVPVWNGELYLETHRGTLTSQSATKGGNRTCERLLREAELWWAAGGAVPPEVTDELHELWNEVLLQQFHDVIPGSSITWVHDDAEAAHARVIAQLEPIIEAALARLAPSGAIVANTAPGTRREVVVVDEAPVGDGPTQHLADGGVACMVEATGMALSPLVAQPCADHVAVTEHTFTNASLAVGWDLDGTIVSIIDVAHGRQLLPSGRSVALELAPDHPVEYDAWNLEAWTTGLGVPVGGVGSVEIIDAGPLVATLRVVRQFGASTVTTDCTLRAGSARLDIAFDIDWHEDEQLLSLMVPLDVSAREASCDIQFGTVMRPMHASTSWDAAKFEVCAHRYVDVAEPSWGVAVLNDGRYGHSLHDGGVRVSLLRAAKYPDPTADHGRHQVTIAVVPHGAGLHDVLREADALNLPLRIRPGQGGVTVPTAPVSVEHSGVQVTAVKRADDGSGDLIVRLYEACGDRVTATVRCPERIAKATRCNLLEEPTSSIDVTDGIVALTLRPFELVTLRVTVTNQAGEIPLSAI